MSTVPKDVNLLLETFFPRRDVYGVWTRGTLGVRTVTAPVTEQLLETHLSGSARIGAHSTDQNDRARWVVIDLDGFSVVAVLDIVAVAARHGIRLAVEASKRMGRYHLWAFFAELVPAWKARVLGCALVQEAGWGRHNIEVFPKQDTLTETEKGLGNFVWLPWNGQDLPYGRTAFLDLTRNQWPPYANQVDYLMGIRRILL